MEIYYQQNDKRRLIDAILRKGTNYKNADDLYLAAFHYSFEKSFDLMEKYDEKELLMDEIGDSINAVQKYMSNHSIPNYNLLYNESFKRLMANFCWERISDVKKVADILCRCELSMQKQTPPIQDHEFIKYNDPIRETGFGDIKVSEEHSILKRAAMSIGEKILNEINEYVHDDWKNKDS